MSPKAIEQRLELVDQLRELAIDLSNAKRLGPVQESQSPDEPSSGPHSGIQSRP